MSEKKDKCENCNIDWGCLNCSNGDKPFSEEYLKVLAELFGDA